MDKEPVLRFFETLTKQPDFQNVSELSELESILKERYLAFEKSVCPDKANTLLPSLSGVYQEECDWDTTNEKSIKKSYLLEQKSLQGDIKDLAKSLKARVAFLTRRQLFSIVLNCQRGGMAFPSMLDSPQFPGDRQSPITLPDVNDPATVEARARLNSLTDIEASVSTFVKNICIDNSQMLDANSAEIAKKMLSLKAQYCQLGVMLMDNIINNRTNSQQKSVTYGVYFQGCKYQPSQLRFLCRNLIDENYLDRSTSEDDFVYVFTGAGHVPDEKLKWTNKLSQLCVLVHLLTSDRSYPKKIDKTFCFIDKTSGSFKDISSASVKSTENRLKNSVYNQDFKLLQIIKRIES